MFKLLKSYFRKLFSGLFGGGQKIFRITFSRVYTLYGMLPFFENQNQFDLDFLLNLSLIRGKYPGIFSPKFEEAFKYFKNKNGLDNHTECLNYIFKIDYNFLFLTKCFYLIKTTSKFDLFIKVFSGINFDHVKRLNKLVQYSFTRKELKTIKQFSNQYHFFINYYYTDNYITLFELNLLNKLS